MTQFPRARGFDNSLALLADGYRFIGERCRELGSDVFETRLLLQKAICMMGEEAAQVFYHPGRFTRQGALPPTVVALLQDYGSVQMQDGAAFVHRKQMFMSLMGPESVRRIGDLMTAHWIDRLPIGETRERITLHPAMQGLLCRTVCEWAGVPLTEANAGKRTREFAAMIDGAGSVGPRNWRGQLLRLRTERWAREIVDKTRAGELDPPAESALRVFVDHRDLDGQPLSTETAAVELLNVLRPTVAVARFITFAALALHDHPEFRERLRAGDDGEVERFVQEVRRFYPFFPLMADKVRQPFDWRGVHFPEGTWVLVALYGTDHDARLWEDPEAFRPDRFLAWDGSPFDFIPQGGGDYYLDHRCPGEWMTVELMKRAVRVLTGAMEFHVPEQDLSIDMSKMPTLPKSGFVIERVRRAPAFAA